MAHRGSKSRLSRPGCGRWSMPLAGFVFAAPLSPMVVAATVSAAALFGALGGRALARGRLRLWTIGALGAVGLVCAISLGALLTGTSALSSVIGPAGAMRAAQRHRVRWRLGCHRCRAARRCAASRPISCTGGRLRRSVVRAARGLSSRRRDQSSIRVGRLDRRCRRRSSPGADGVRRLHGDHRGDLPAQ